MASDNDCFLCVLQGPMPVMQCTQRIKYVTEKSGGFRRTRWINDGLAGGDVYSFRIEIVRGSSTPIVETAAAAGM